MNNMKGLHNAARETRIHIMLVTMDSCYAFNVTWNNGDAEENTWNIIQWLQLRMWKRLTVHTGYILERLVSLLQKMPLMTKWTTTTPGDEFMLSRAKLICCSYEKETGPPWFHLCNTEPARISVVCKCGSAENNKKCCLTQLFQFTP